MYQPICCRGVIILEPFMRDQFDPNSVVKTLGPEHRELTKSIGKLYPEGTCFLIAKSSKHFRLKNNKIVGLALTNYHIGYDYSTSCKCYYSVEFIIDNQDYSYTSESLLELHSILPGIQFSATSGLPYCLSNDICLMLIIEKTGTEPDLEEIEICNEEELMDVKSAIVSGFPIFSNYQYIIPTYKHLPDCIRRAFTAFHMFNKQIISEGTVQISDSGLADLKLSATCGMSGSPILVQSGNSFKCIGIYCGGPPLEGQHLLMRILDCINNKNYEEALNLFPQLPFDNNRLFEYNFHFRFLKRIFYMFMILSNALDQERYESEHPEEYLEIIKGHEYFDKMSLDAVLSILQEEIKKLLIQTTEIYRGKEHLSYNVGISINTEAFKRVRYVIEIFKNIEGDFDDVSEIKRIIEQLVT